MTRRAYISCPLEAALAAKNFGMRFTADHLKDTAGNAVKNRKVPLWILRKLCAIESFDKYYIHPESLSLLEPMEGDYIYVLSTQFGWRGKYATVRELFMQDGAGLSKDKVRELRESGAKIDLIRRNGKPFPTIQYEDVE